MLLVVGCLLLVVGCLLLVVCVAAEGSLRLRPPLVGLFPVVASGRGATGDQ